MPPVYVNEIYLQLKRRVEWQIYILEHEAIAMPSAIFAVADLGGG